MKLEDVLHIVVILGIALFLSACGKHGSPAEPVSCHEYAGAFMEVYPDGVARKSEVAACSDGCNQISSIGDSTNSFKQCSH